MPVYEKESAKFGKRLEATPVSYACVVGLYEVEGGPKVRAAFFIQERVKRKIAFQLPYLLPLIRDFDISEEDDGTYLHGAWRGW
jgi:hypothetical protein